MEISGCSQTELSRVKRDFQHYSYKSSAYAFTERKSNSWRSVFEEKGEKQNSQKYPWKHVIYGLDKRTVIHSRSDIWQLPHTSVYKRLRWSPLKNVRAGLWYLRIHSFNFINCAMGFCRNTYAMQNNQEQEYGTSISTLISSKLSPTLWYAQRLLSN